MNESACLPDLMEIVKSTQNIMAASIGAGVAYWYNRKKQNLDHDVFKRELFLKYTTEYAKMNGRLEALINREQTIEFENSISPYEKLALDDVWFDLFERHHEIKPEWLDIAFDYINMCAEQYYWFKKGFVDQDVWNCWQSGMNEWNSYSFFLRKIAAREKERNSKYYNNDFLEIFSQKQK